MHAPGSHLYRYLLLALTMISIVVLALPAHLQAVDIAPATSPAFLQTSGPRTSLGTGDFYTNINGANNPLGHTVEVLVPCTWPAATPITFAIFDPEIGVPNQTTPPIIDDEIRNATNAEITDPLVIPTIADNTRFTLLAPGGATVGPVTFTPGGGSNLLWVELATFTTNQAGYGCGSYRVRTTTGDGPAAALEFDNDDNSWRLRVVSDPDCTVTPGTCSGIGATPSGRIGDANGVDNLDGLPGTGDEILIGMIDASFQHTAPATTSCLDLYEFVDGLVSPVNFHNFDMDESNSPTNISITYFPPSTSNYAPSFEGVTSENADWNPPPATAFPNPPRGGDSFVIDANDVGWWRIRTCVQNDNQYIVEGQLGVPAYFSQPPTPRMALSKTNGETLLQDNQVLTYTMTFTNTSNVAPPTPPNPGSAVNTVLTDQLPVDLTFISCSLVAPVTGTCAHNGVNPGGVVTFNLTNMFRPGEGGSLRVVAQFQDIDGDPTNVVTNRATLTYRDPLNNPYPPVLTEVSNPTAITLASFSSRWMGSAVRVNWRTGSEDKTLGFHLLRATSPDLSQATQVTAALIPARGGGSSYGWTDQAAAPGATYYYWLRESETGGATNTYGPTSTVGTGSAAFYQQFLPFITR